MTRTALVCQAMIDRPGTLQQCRLERGRVTQSGTGRDTDREREGHGEKGRDTERERRDKERHREGM